MPQLDATQYAKFVSILEDLKPMLSDLDEVPQNFVSDQIERNEQFGARTFVSPKQMAWLERLHEENVGTEDHGASARQEGPDKNDPRFSGEADDEVPF